MSISTDAARATTLLPPTSPPSHARGARVRALALKPLCPVRMAEADAADREVYDICEEISQTLRKLPENVQRTPVRRKKAAAR